MIVDVTTPASGHKTVLDRQAADEKAMQVTEIRDKGHQRVRMASPEAWRISEIETAVAIAFPNATSSTA